MMPQPPKNLSFRVDTMFVGNGNRVGVIRPNELGIYCGLPLMVLNETTQQNTYYDPKSMIDQITNPNTTFNKIMSDGKKMGEWGHPTFFGLNKDETIQRLVTVDERNTSHLFTSLYTDAPGPSGTVVVRGDVKPTGPMGAVFKESLEDPVVNTSFSLRAYVTTDTRPNGLKYRTVRQLCTWDVVGASGYKTTDKAHALGLESFSGDTYEEYEIQVIDNGMLMIDQIALESYSDTELNEIFGVRKVSQLVQSRTFVKPDRELMARFPNLYPKAVYNDHIKEF